MELQGGAKVMADKKKTVLDDSRILFVEEKKVPLMKPKKDDKPKKKGQKK